VTTSVNAPKPGRQRIGVKSVTYAATGLVCVGLAISIGACSSTSTVTRTVPGPTVTATVQVAGPTVTQTASAPPPAAGTKLGSWSGSGNQVTPAFNAPASGDYIVSWTFSGNDVDGIPGGDNFIIGATDSGADALSLPNVIATSGSGSTEVTDASGSESFNVQATGSWIITITSASELSACRNGANDNALDAVPPNGLKTGPGHQPARSPLGPRLLTPAADEGRRQPA
jgi:hypothetical protein